MVIGLPPPVNTLHPVSKIEYAFRNLRVYSECINIEPAKIEEYSRSSNESSHEEKENCTSLPMTNAIRDAQQDSKTFEHGEVDLGEVKGK